MGILKELWGLCTEVLKALAGIAVTVSIIGALAGGVVAVAYIVVKAILGAL